MASTPRLGTAELLYRCARKMGLRPTWVTPDGMFAISVHGTERYINFARSPLNSHTGASLAKDKYLTRLILARHNMQNIPFARPQTQASAEAFLAAHGKIIAKPVEGSGSRDIHVVTNAAQLADLTITGYILEKYIAGKEMRYLILNGEVIGVHQSEYGTSVEEDRVLRRISYPKTAWDAALAASSLQIARVLDLAFVAVDFLVDDTGRAYILEVNTTPGLKWFHAPSTGPKVDVARLFLEAIVGKGRPVASLPGRVSLGSSPALAYS